LLCVAFFALPRATSATVVPTPALVEWSFQVCQADPDSFCELSFPSGASSVIFGEMLTFYLNGRRDGGTDLAAALDMCSVGCLAPLVPNCTACCVKMQFLWLTEMRDANICSGGLEVWVPGIGCSCIEGVNCRADCVGELGSSLWLVYILAGVLLGMTAAYLAWAMIVIRNMNRSIVQLRNEIPRVANSTALLPSQSSINGEYVYHSISRDPSLVSDEDY
jgi:hypothetical protein